MAFEASKEKIAEIIAICAIPAYSVAFILLIVADAGILLNEAAPMPEPYSVDMLVSLLGANLLSPIILKMTVDFVENHAQIAQGRRE